MKFLKNIIKKIFNLDMGYKVIEYPYIFENHQYIGYIIIRPYIIFGLYGYDRIKHFASKEELDEFLSDDLIVDSKNFIQNASTVT